MFKWIIKNNIHQLVHLYLLIAGISVLLVITSIYCWAVDQSGITTLNDPITVGTDVEFACARAFGVNVVAIWFISTDECGGLGDARGRCNGSQFGTETLRISCG